MTSPILPPDWKNVEVVHDSLIDAGQQDQRIRMAFQAKPELRENPAFLKEWAAVDAANFSLLQQIVSVHGWPKCSLVGEKAENYAFLIAQHAPGVAFMEQVFQLRAALPAHEIGPGTQPLMEDRLLIRKGQPQHYGTQFHGGPDGKTHLYPIAGIDMAKLLAGDRLQMEIVDARRKTAGIRYSLKKDLNELGIVRASTALTLAR